MQKITVSLEERYVYELEARQRLNDADSRSAAVRDVFDEYEDLRAEYEELHTEYEALEAERDDLQDRLEAREDRIEDLETQLRERSQIEDKIEDLPDKIRKRQIEPAPPWPIRWYQYFTKGDYREDND